MKIKDAANTALGEVITIQATDMLYEAAHTLVEQEVGALVVYEEGDPVGVCSERDLVRAVVDGVDLNLETVANYMTDSLVTVDEEEFIERGVELMLENRIRHLVVMQEGEVSGMLSARDILNAVKASGS